ncbi:ester cyclase [Streptomyces sp. NPDC013157]|uniref:nuclear transport factor 2 family protein n=1 Tax=Streptomyces sp. NPDC013157 TaxID=3364861 RepID=UPI00367D7166
MRPLTRTLAGALALSTVLLVGEPAMAASRPAVTAARAEASQISRSKALVTDFTQRLYNRHDLSAIDAYLDADFTQHDPRIADGPTGLRAYLTAQNAAHPDAYLSVKRVIAEGNLVAVHSNLVLDPGTRGYSVLDLYRLSGGKIVEHWDTTQEVPATTVSGNDMFSTLSSPQVSRPDPSAPTALNKQLVTDMYKQVFVDKDVTAFDRYVVDPYYQHNPGFANGIQAAKDGISGMFSAFPGFHSDTYRVIAEGDLVVLQSRGTFTSDMAQGVFDIYRVRNGKVVEHWDIVQNVPSTSSNDNSMF